MIDRDTVLQIYDKCGSPTGDETLDEVHRTYNEGSPREDWPNYYRFLYHLSGHLACKKIGAPILVELGCHYGAASLHFIRGGGIFTACAYGVDVVSRIKPIVKEEEEKFHFHHGRSDDPKFHTKFKEKSVDVLLIDSDHSYETTKKEFELWSPKVVSGGLILFDDIDAPEYADGCGKFFKELEGDKISLPHLHPDNWGFGLCFKK